MAKLYFRWSAMNAGKSTALLQVAHNYEERGQKVDVFTSALDDRYGTGRVTSRLGVSREAATFHRTKSFLEHYRRKAFPNCILVDEAQFLTAAQAGELHRLAHLWNVPVICCGLRTDFRGKPFEGAVALLSLADSLDEVKTVCRCGHKATMTVRLDEKGQRVREGDQVQIGGNDRYESVCPRRFYTGNC